MTQSNSSDFNRLFIIRIRTQGAKIPYVTVQNISAHSNTAFV